MNVVNCKNCGRQFNAMSNERLCPACMQEREDKFQEVKKFLQDNPNSSVDVVSRKMEVSVKQLKQWVREERLIFSEASMVGIECEKCGKLIRTGRFCDECKKSISNVFEKALDRPKPAEPAKSSRDKDRMRFL